MLHMLLIAYDPAAPSDGSPSRQSEHAKLEAELREQRVYVSGAALFPLQFRKRVRQGAVTDGPFVDTKEVVGGYYIVDCDQATAVEIAARIPVDSRSWIEVVPIALFHPDAARIKSLEGFVDERLRGPRQ